MVSEVSRIMPGPPKSQPNGPAIRRIKAISILTVLTMTFLEHSFSYLLLIQMLPTLKFNSDLALS